MSDPHVTPELLEAVSRGDLKPHVVLELGWGHLLRMCPVCLAGLRAWQPPIRERRAPKRTEKERQAKRDLRELLALSQKERLAKIHGSSRRFRGLPLAHSLLDEAKERTPEQPQERHDLAEAAEQVLLRTPDAPGYFDALARATAYRADALRAAGKVHEAEERIATARSLIRHQDEMAALVCAEVDQVESNLRRDQGRCEEAADLLSRAAALIELAGPWRERETCALLWIRE